MEEFPSNSRQPVNPQPAPKKIEPVISGKIIQKKQPLHKKFVNTFFSGSAKGARDFVILNVLIPSAQKMLYEAFTGGAARMIWHDPIAGGFPQGRPQQPTSFTNYATRFTVSGTGQSAPEVVSPQARATHNFNDVILEDRLSADRVLNGMFDLLNEYESVSVADFYSLLGVTAQYTDQAYGWTDLRGSDIRLVPQGYMLILPKPKPLGRA